MRFIFPLKGAQGHRYFFSINSPFHLCTPSPEYICVNIILVEKSSNKNTQNMSSNIESVHMYTHVHMHTCTHAHMYTCTHAHMYTCTHVHMHSCSHLALDHKFGCY